MRVCPICNKRFKQQESVAVLSFPVKTKNQEGSYDIWGAFLSNENVIHYHCFSKVAKNLIDIIKGRSTVEQNIQYQTSVVTNISNKYDEKAKTILGILRDIGEDVNIKKVKDFLIINHNLSDPNDIISEWLKQRSKNKHESSLNTV